MTDMTAPTRPSADIARRLAAGEPLTSVQTSKEYGVTQSLLGTVIRDLKANGLTFRSRLLSGPGNPKEYWVVLPSDHFVDRAQWGKGENVESLRHKKPAAVSKKPLTPKEPKRLKVGVDHPVPGLGTTLQVFMLTVAEDGQVGLGLRNDEGSWVVDVHGFAAK